MSLTYLIAFLTNVAEKIFIIMQFQPTFEVISAYDNMIVEVSAIDMSGDDCLVIFKFIKAFDELHTDIVCFLRRDCFANLEGLNEMIKSNAIRLVTIYLLRGKKGLIC